MKVKKLDVNYNISLNIHGTNSLFIKFNFTMSVLE